MSCCCFEGGEEGYYVEFSLLFDEPALFALVVWGDDGVMSLVSECCVFGVIKEGRLLDDIGLIDYRPRF